MEYITKKLARQTANKPAASHMDADKLLKLFSAQNSRKARSFGERVTFVLNPTLIFWLRVVNGIMDIELFLQTTTWQLAHAGTLLWFNQSDFRQRHWQIKPVAFNNRWIILHPTSIHKRHKCPNMSKLCISCICRICICGFVSRSFQNGWLFRQMSNRRKPRHKLGKGNGAIPEKTKNMEGWQWLWVNWVNLWNQGTTDQGVIPSHS